MNLKGQNVGYIRVSSIDQCEDRQLDSIRSTLDKIFTDKASGKDTHRPALQACFNHLREGDVLHVHSIDRLARNLQDLLQIVQKLISTGVTVKFMKENMEFTSDTTNPFQKLQLQLIGACSEFEREMIRERQKEGIAIARKNGKKFGRKAVVTDELKLKINAALASGDTKAMIAKKLGIGRATLYRALDSAA